MAGRDVKYSLFPANETDTKIALAKPHSSVLVYILVPLGSVLLVALVIAGVSVRSCTVVRPPK